MGKSGKEARYKDFRQKRRNKAKWQYPPLYDEKRKKGE